MFDFAYFLDRGYGFYEDTSLFYFPKTKMLYFVTDMYLDVLLGINLIKKVKIH